MTGKIPVKYSTYEWLEAMITGDKEASGMAPKCHVKIDAGKGKIVHTAEPALLNCLPEKAAASVPRGRVNFRPRRW